MNRLYSPLSICLEMGRDSFDGVCQAFVNCIFIGKYEQGIAPAEILLAGFRNVTVNDLRLRIKQINGVISGLQTFTWDRCYDESGLFRPFDKGLKRIKKFLNVEDFSKLMELDTHLYDPLVFKRIYESNPDAAKDLYVKYLFRTNIPPETKLYFPLFGLSFTVEHIHYIIAHWGSSCNKEIFNHMIENSDVKSMKITADLFDDIDRGNPGDEDIIIDILNMIYSAGIHIFADCPWTTDLLLSCVKRDPTKCNCCLNGKCTKIPPRKCQTKNRSSRKRSRKYKR